MRSGSVPATLSRQQGQGVAHFAAGGVWPSPDGGVSRACAGAQPADNTTQRSQLRFVAGLRSASASVSASSAPSICASSAPATQRSATPGSFSWLPQHGAGQVPLARSAPRSSDSSRGPDRAGRSCARLASPYPISASVTLGPTQGLLEGPRFVPSRPATVSGALAAPRTGATTPTRRACPGIAGPPSEGSTAELARLRTMLALARRVLASWTTTETRRVIQEAFESIDRSRLRDAVWSSDDVRRFGHRVLTAQGIEPAAWPEHAWHAIYINSSPEGQGHPLRDLGMAERLAFAIIERRSAELEHRATELEPSVSNGSIQASSTTANSVSPRSARSNFRGGSLVSGRFLGERSLPLATVPSESYMPPAVVPAESSISNASIPGASESYMPPVAGYMPPSTSAPMSFVPPVPSRHPAASSRAPTPTPNSLPRSFSSRAKRCDVEIVCSSGGSARHAQRPHADADAENRIGSVCPRLKATPEPTGARSVSAGPASLEDRAREQAVPMGPRSVSVGPRPRKDLLTMAAPPLGAPMVTLPQGWQTPSIGGAPSVEEPPCDEAQPQQGQPSPRDCALPAGSVQRMQSGEPASFHSAVFRNNAASPRSPPSIFGDTASAKASPNSEIARLYQDLARERSERQALAQRVEALARTQVTDAPDQWVVCDSHQLQQRALPMCNENNAMAASLNSALRTTGFVPAMEDDAAKECDVLASSTRASAEDRQGIEDNLDIHISTSERNVLPERGTAGPSSVAPSGDDQDGTLMEASLTSPIFTSSSPIGASPMVSTQASVSPWSTAAKEEASPDPAVQKMERRSPRGGKKSAARCQADDGDTPSHAVHEMMLADARAILAELEHDLVAPFKAPPVKAVGASRRTEKAESEDSGPSVLSFYRRKCLELASQVHRRDTEVVRLRRALKEARTVGRTVASPSAPRSLDCTLQIAATADDKPGLGEPSPACGFVEQS